MPTGPRTGGRGIVLTTDYSQWTFWWGFNKDRFLRLKDSVHAGAITTHSDAFYMGAGTVRGHETMRPQQAVVERDVVPALAAILKQDVSRDVTASCLIALAKFGSDTDQFELLPALREALRSDNQQIRETAAIAYGVSGRTEGIPDLIELTRDSRAGRQLCDRSAVDLRTRSFAAYALGLVASRSPQIATKERAFEAFQGLLKDGDSLRDDLLVAAVHGIGILDPRADSARDRRLVDRSLAALDRIQSRVDVSDWVRAHAPTAIARLLSDRTDDLRASYYAQRFAALLHGSKRDARQFEQSAILALGHIGLPGHDDVASVALREQAIRGRDAQSRYFALIGLGQIGGTANRDVLLDVLTHGNKALARPWAALALGVFSHRERQRGLAAGPDPLIGQLLHKQLEDVKNPSSRGAFAIALGMAGYSRATDDLHEILREDGHREDLAGHVCTGLALMGDRASIAPIRAVAKKSLRRPEILRSASVALGVLGDKNTANLLLDLLGSDGRSVSRMAAVSVGLGLIGDRHSVAPLLEMVRDESSTKLARAFAVIALGSVIDSSSLPWNASLACNVNYRANLSTLTDGVFGVLDLL